MSQISYVLNGDYSALSNPVNVYITVSLAPGGNYDVREFTEFGVGYAAFNSDTGNGPILFRNSGSATSDLYYSTAGYLFDFSDNTNAAKIVGGTFGDVLTGGSGNNVFDGAGGNDVLNGGSGTDVFTDGSAGDGAGTDRLYGNDGDDTFILHYVLGGEIFDGGNGIDTLDLSNESDGHNLVLGGGTFRSMRATFTGFETIIATNHGDTITGTASADAIDGRGGSDRMVGGSGDDIYFVDDIGDIIIELANDGVDSIAARVSYSLAVDQSIETMRTTNTAGAASINLTGNELVQSLLGNAGANRLDGGGGADIMRGFGGNDLYYVDNAGDRVFEIAGQGSDRVAVSTSYTLQAGQSVEVLQTRDMSGTTAISLAGNEIAQVIKGNNGTNVIYGKAGGDVLYGYGGADTFVFDTALGVSNRDTIMDFSHAADTIRLDKSVFAALTIGSLSSNAFKDIGAAGAAVDADDRVIYNRSTGALFYDADGSGTGAAIHFATLLTRPTDISHLDFFTVA